MYNASIAHESYDSMQYNTKIMMQLSQCCILFINIDFYWVPSFTLFVKYF